MEIKNVLDATKDLTNVNLNDIEDINKIVTRAETIKSVFKQVFISNRIYEIKNTSTKELILMAKQTSECMHESDVARFDTTNILVFIDDTKDNIVEAVKNLDIKKFKIKKNKLIINSLRHMVITWNIRDIHGFMCKHAAFSSNLFMFTNIFDERVYININKFLREQRPFHLDFTLVSTDSKTNSKYDVKAMLYGEDVYISEDISFLSRER